MLGQVHQNNIHLHADPGGDFASAGSGVPRDLSEFQRVTPADLDLAPEAATAVISSAQKFVIPVPQFLDGGQPLAYPCDPSAPGYDQEKAGKPIVDWQGNPIGERGIVFFNGKDKAVQAAPGDGEGVIILNLVTREQAECLREKIGEYADDPQNLTLPQLRAVLDYARKELGLEDMYNSTRAFVASKMTPAGDVPTDGAGQPIEAYGLKKRDDRDICHAVFVPGRVIFEGPAATPQVFEEGAVILQQGKDVRGIQPEVFEESYCYADGRPIDRASALKSKQADQRR